MEQLKNSATENPQESSQAESFAVTAPAISLPKGGGAIRGLGEKFAANPVTGTGSMTVPIFTSPGRAGFSPQLAVSYDSGSGNGIFGFGWNLSLPSITRKTDKGLPRYQDADESDVFILSGTEDLVPVLEDEGAEATGYTIKRYRPRIEGLFARIERWTSSDGDVHWRSISRDNILTIYGKDEFSRVTDPANSRRIFSWLISETRDDKGNAIIYDYKAEDGVGVKLSSAHQRNRGKLDAERRKTNRYLKRIRYGNRTTLLDGFGDRPRFLSHAAIENAEWLFEAVFDYGDHDLNNPLPAADRDWDYRKDTFSTYRAGFEIRTCRLCQRVLMFHHFRDEEAIGENCLVRSTDFTYAYEKDEADPKSAVYTFLNSATQTGYQKRGDTYESKSLPPLEFSYSQPKISQKIETLDRDSLENLPIGLDGSQYQWVDLDGEGLSGILTEQAGGWYYKPNLSAANTFRVTNADTGAEEEQIKAKFAPLKPVARKPSFAAIGGGQQQFVDLAGDGQLDLAVFDGPTPGFYERTNDADWVPFRTFESLPQVAWHDPNLKFIDLTGDGHADILISEDEVFYWYPSRAESGFGGKESVRKTLDEETSPRVIFADGTQSIYLADLSGDGLSDIARIRNGEICYWPNLGYGRFGNKVTMDNAPWFDYPDQFNQQRIRLADIDGSGTADVIYLGEDAIRLYFNESGNGWSAPHTLEHFPRTNNLIAVNALDLLGNGTACLAWSSPLPADAGQPLRYLKLMGENKPHLLTKVVNNLGAETHIYYAPSTKFYVQDKQNSEPWITKVHFPVHVVERVETIDKISNSRFSTHYAYHHGYFDGIEREFRGFGRVDQWDTEEYATIEGNEDFLTFANIDKASHMPPVLTKTWFHTGVYMGRDRVSNFFAGLLDVHDRGEYYREPAWRGDDTEASKRLLPDTILPDELTHEEAREACRSLKGSMLRQEVYALDGVGVTEDYPHGHPYTVTEQNFTIRRLQPRADNRHAVFFTHAREAISYHYERNPDDPRTTHAMTLEVDDYGNVLKSIAIGYGRREPDVSLALADQAKQTQLLVTYTENKVTNAVASGHDYRTPLPCATSTYEITGLKPQQHSPHFRFNEFSADGALVLADLPEIEYQQTADPGVPQKRLIEKVRTLYRRNDLSGLLPQYQLESLALPGESYKLAFTPGLLEQVYQHPHEGQPDEKLLPEDPNDLAKILGVTGSAITGIASDQGGYVQLDGDGYWWIPSGRVFFSPDEAGAQAELEEARQCFFTPRRYRDPFGHSATVDLDYCLLVRETRDALGNTSRAEHDFRVLQARQMTGPNGNRTAVAFDTLGLVVATAVMGKVDETDPDKMGDTLDDPTTRLEYELFAWKDHKQPTSVHTWAREQHGAANPRWQESYLYSDGFGRELQTKIQAEPGDAPQRAEQDPVKPYTPGALLRDENGELLPPAHCQSRWVGSGRVIYNNKGKPVKQYEPFFSCTPLYEPEPEMTDTGVTPVLFYDPLGRVIVTLYPNQTYAKVVFGPWRQTSFDVNDTCAPRNRESGDPRTDPDIGAYVSEYFQSLPADPEQPWQSWYAQRMGGAMGDAERIAAEKAAVHADTPGIAHFDALGRPFLSIAHNRVVCEHHDDDGKEERFETRAELDIEGNQLTVIDAKQRVVMRYQYDMLGTVIRQDSMEAGARWTLNDISGKPIRRWDSRGFAHRLEYDALRRPLSHFVSAEGQSEQQVEKTVYGDTPGVLPAPELSNHRGKPYQVYDNAGVTSAAYDFKGNLLHSTRRLRADYQQTADWREELALERETFHSRTWYDALNRPVQMLAPHSDQPDKRCDILRPGYNEANLLERMAVWPQQAEEPTTLLDPASADLPAITNIDYDAKGQRTRIEYGSGVVTRYAYDPLTYRLTHLHTTRPAGANGLAADIFVTPGTVQDLHYTYDPAGNIVRIEDQALKTVTYNNESVQTAGHYTYDALYRLIQAAGREHIGQSTLVGASNGNSRDYPFAGSAHRNDLQALRNYTESYRYDEVGNFTHFMHQAAHGNWQRDYHYQETSLLAEPDEAVYSNRLSRTLLHPNANEPWVEDYHYDAHGNMLQMPHLPLMQWDHNDQLAASSRQVANNGATPETTYYVYDASGQRVRTITENQTSTGEASSRKNERIYLGGFELYREYSGDTCKLERESLHVMDDQQRIALIETKTLDTSSSANLHTPIIRYQLANHLGSASLELAQNGAFISYEEYHPYGTTAFQAHSSAEVSLKRYRYTGMERDEETGLNYHGARHYAPWLARWCSPDPAGLIDGLNRFIYSKNTPIILHDSDGRQSRQPLKGKLIDNRIGITFSKDSMITAESMLEMIKSSKRLRPWMKKLFSVKDNILLVKKTFKFPEDEEVPEWFQLFINTALTNSVHVTTGEVRMTSEGVILKGDYEGSDIPGHLFKSGLGEEHFSPLKDKPNTYESTSITLGRWENSMVDKFAGWNGKNFLRSQERNLIVIGNRQVFGKISKDINDEQILETFFHEVSAHQGVFDELTLHEGKNEKEALEQSTHSKNYEPGLLLADSTKSDQIAEDIAQFFNTKTDRTLYKIAKIYYNLQKHFRSEK